MERYNKFAEIVLHLSVVYCKDYIDYRDIEDFTVCTLPRSIMEYEEDYAIFKYMMDCWERWSGKKVDKKLILKYQEGVSRGEY